MRRSIQQLLRYLRPRPGSGGGSRPRGPGPFSFERLEPRIALAAAGLVSMGAQPTGTLSGRIVYTSAGHGIEYEGGSTNGGWLTDRPDYSEIVEDFGNQDQFTLYVDYLFRAGATVVPMRPVGRQLNEVVIDNDMVQVSYSGSWSDSTTATRWYDEDYDATADAVRYRFASVNTATESATATYTPSIPAAGFYPVYAWAAPGANRTNQLYKVNHSGGQTQVRVDHREVGHGWVYLGTYHFAAGSEPQSGSVQISNHSTAGGSVVIADAIRFGNGMGDVKDGPNGMGDPSGTVSGYPREDESSLFWLYRGIGLGVSPTSILTTSNVNAPSEMAEYMNQNGNPFGKGVYIGYHSNGTTGNPATATARGAVGLIEADASERTPNNASLALYTGRQINQDMSALNGRFEHNWNVPSSHTYTNDFGEINLGPSAEMDATIIEVGFHDNTQDSQLLRDPKARDQLARSVYEATLEYFANFGSTPRPGNVTLPSAPGSVRALSSASGEATVSWSPGLSSANGYNGVHGSPATGFRIYASADGYGFDGGTFVAGGGATTATLTGLDPTVPYYFKVVAVNAGGESKATEVVTLLPSGGAKQVLIVNGFDRFDRTQNFRYPFYSPAGNLVDRVWSRYNNSFDYVVQTHAAIAAARPGVHVDSASNEAVISGAVDLAAYDAVVWILGNESTADDTFNGGEQTEVAQFIAGGGSLFVTGSEIGWDLDQQNGGRAFFESTLNANYVADDAGTYAASPAAGGIFAGLPAISFSAGAQFSSLTSQTYNVATPDVISPQPGAQLALNYAGGAGGAAIQVEGQNGRGNVVVFGFPFETITTAAHRASLMGRVLDYFDVAAITPVVADFNDDGTVDGADFLIWQRGFGAPAAQRSQGDADGDGAVDAADLAAWQTQFGSPPPEAAVQAAAALLAEEAPHAPTAVAAAWLAQRAQQELAPIRRPAATPIAEVASEAPPARPSAPPLAVQATAPLQTGLRRPGYRPASPEDATFPVAVDAVFGRDFPDPF